MIDELKENHPTNAVVLSFDEKGRTPVKQFEGRKWTQEECFIPSIQKVKGLFNLIAARDIHTSDFHYRFYDFKNSFVVIDMFEHLLKCYPGKELYVILDNWSCHKSEAVKAFVDLNERLHLVYLPFCASWLNDVERDFIRIEKEVLRNSNFQSVREAMVAIDDFVENEPSFNGRRI